MLRYSNIKDDGKMYPIGSDGLYLNIEDGIEILENLNARLDTCRRLLESSKRELIMLKEMKTLCMLDDVGKSHNFTMEIAENKARETIDLLTVEIDELFDEIDVEHFLINGSICNEK